ncbi:RND transporter [Candidatus Tokpelaia sp.]|nr:RND transporter [Candidatus Tokpelaia sp.]
MPFFGRAFFTRLKQASTKSLSLAGIGACPATKNSIIGFCAFLLASCAVGPDYKKPDVALPAQWGDKAATTAADAAGQNRQAELAGWWRRLRDPLLDQMVTAAISDNLDIASAKARVREARALAWQTAGALFPSLDSDASYKRRKTGGPFSVTQDHYGGSFDSAWEIDLFGLNRRALEAAQAGFAAAQEDLRAVMVTLIGDVASNYVEARRLQAQLRLSEDTARSQRQTADLIGRKFQTGAVSNLDANNAAGQAADMEANIPRLTGQLAVIKHRLAVLLGQPPAAVNDLIESNYYRQAGDIPVVPGQLPATIPADILLSRPDVRAAERRLAQSTATIGQREAQRYPAISLTGNIATNATHPDNLGKNSSISWVFGPSISLPLFRGGALVAGVEIARAQRDRNFIALRSAVLTALEDVENALVSLKNDKLLAAKETEAANAYQTSLTLSRNLYESGNTSFLELLTAERSYFSARQGALNARAAATTDYISLMKALGGGWDGLVDYRKPEIIDKNTGPHFGKLPTLSEPPMQPQSAQDNS